jgi:hypothetical protein
MNRRKRARIKREYQINLQSELKYILINLYLIPMLRKISDSKKTPALPVK